MARSSMIAILAMALFAVASAADSCTYPVIKWNKLSYKLGNDTVTPQPSTCPSGFTYRPDWTSMVESTVLNQALTQKIWPAITGDDADVYTCPEGLRWLKFDSVSSCLANNSRNPRNALVNGVVQFVCKNQARMRSISVVTDSTYNKNC